MAISSASAAACEKPPEANEVTRWYTSVGSVRKRAGIPSSAGIPKLPRAARNASMTAANRYGRSSGARMRTPTTGRLAPSRRAASSRCRGTRDRPAPIVR